MNASTSGSPAAAVAGFDRALPAGLRQEGREQDVVPLAWSRACLSTLWSSRMLPGQE